MSNILYFYLIQIISGSFILYSLIFCFIIYKANKMSLLDNNNGGPSIGNYKGVMLCNRPFGGVSGAAKSNEVGVKAFGCGVVSEEIGAHVSLASKEKHKIKRPKKESALTKHRKWLAELQNTKDRLEMEFVMELENKKDQSEKFKTKEKQMRATSRALLRGEEPPGPESESDAKSEGGNSNTSSSYKESKGAKKAGGKKINKPKWALQAEAKSAGNDADAISHAVDEELAELMGDGDHDEMNDLLGFAQTLNYEKYMGDLEVKTMMEQVRRRIADLERQVSQEEKRENDSEVDRAKKEIMALRELEKGPAYGPEDYDEDEGNEEDRAREAAKDILAAHENIKSVHSTKSAAALVKSVKDKGVNSEGGATKNMPIIVIHDPNEGTRLDPTAKNVVSNMPYQHRNPAI